MNERTPELSGIVLSLVDPQGRPRNGFLRLQDIYDLKLNAAPVTLSSCRTALGKQVEGEGLIGLTRGFLHAGVSGVLASLWAVEDGSTAALMKMFYEAALRQGKPASQALQSAQNRMRQNERWRDPYFWAGFVYQGR